MTYRHLIVTGLFLVVLPITASAHSGNTDSSGCHTCRTNCSKWGLSTGEYHCHRSKGLPQPEAPIRSHYNESGGTTEYWPEYEGSSPSYNTAPSKPAPIKLPGSCPDGFTLSKVNGQCITLDQSCVEQVGPSTHKTVSTGGAYCSCDSGYEWDYKTLHCIKESEVKSPPTFVAPPTAVTTTVEKKNWLQRFLEWLF